MPQLPLHRQKSEISSQMIKKVERKRSHRHEINFIKQTWKIDSASLAGLRNTDIAAFRFTKTVLVF